LSPASAYDILKTVPPLATQTSLTLLNFKGFAVILRLDDIRTCLLVFGLSDALTYLSPPLWIRPDQASPPRRAASSLKDPVCLISPSPPAFLTQPGVYLKFYPGLTPGRVFSSPSLPPSAKGKFPSGLAPGILGSCPASRASLFSPRPSRSRKQRPLQVEERSLGLF